jgi:lipopolysaccharide cholinephosphotransferase
MDSDLIRAKTVMVQILKDIDTVCNEHDISYWIDFGTLLGAVRHKGFIPWDDDIDITMPREDYNKFIEVAQKELNNKYFIQLRKTDSNYKRDWLKIRDKNSIFLEYGSIKNKDNGKNGIFVDIFPLDRIKKKNKIYFDILRKLYQINPFKGQFDSNINKFLHIALSPFYLIRNLVFRISIKFINPQGSLAIYGLEAWFYHSFNYNDIFPLTNIEFEGFEFKAPREYKKHLKEYYGNYMELPPEEQRHYHAKYIGFLESSKQ